MAGIGTPAINPQASSTTPDNVNISQVGGSAIGSTLPVAIAGSTDSNNSTTTPLAGNATYTGTATDVTNYSSIIVYVFSDKSSAASGVLIEFSSDGTNWNDASPFTFTSGGAAPNNGQAFVAAKRAQWMRVVYTNGASAQTSFRLETLLSPNIIGGDTLSINGTVNANNHGMLTLSQIIGLSTAGGGTYVPVKVNPSGSVQVGGTVGGEFVTDQITDTAGTAYTPQFATITASASGATTIVAAVASKKIRVLNGLLISNGVVNVKFQSHVTPTDLTGLLYCTTNSGFQIPYSPTGNFQTIAGEALDINLSGNIAVGGWISYITV